MHPSVLPFFKKYSIEHEGFTPFMYADTLNLVTTGIGNLIDNSKANSFDTSAHAMEPAMGLPWKFKAPGWTSKNPLAQGTASQADIADSWIRTKLKAQEDPGFNTRSSGFAYAGLTPLTLDMDGIERLVSGKIASNEKELRGLYPNWDSLPADAQLGMMSMAWAMGSHFFPVRGFKGFKDAIDALDFETAAKQSQFKGGGSITDPKSRNHDLDIMFKNAAASKKVGADPGLLFFPGTSPSGSIAINPGIGASFLPKATVANVTGAAIVAGLFGYGFYDWWTTRTPTKRRKS